jgi:P4 family phage/plasmid primase-like protien
MAFDIEKLTDELMEKGREAKIKYAEDKRKMLQEGTPNLMLPSNKGNAIIIAGVSEENYDKIIKEKSEERKKPFKIFTDKQEQAKKFEEVQPLFYDKSGCWWLWNSEKFRWDMVDEVDILNMMGDNSGCDIISSKSRTEILNSLKQQGRKLIPKPIKPTWIQFQDKIFDVLTGETYSASPEYFVTNPIAYKLNSELDEATPCMDKIFEEWVGKDHVRTLYEFLAFCMLPDYPIHRIFSLVGAGMNGKTCFLRLLKKFVGDENVTATELDTLISSRFEITRLYKKLVCIMGETNFSELSKTSVLKKASGQDMIGFEYKNKTPFTDTNYAKIVIATNNLPETTDKTIGFYRRWMIIDFPNQFTEEKDILGDIPEQEYECLALKCCSILHDLLKVRKFTNEGSVEDRQKRYEEKSNPADKFIREFCDTEDGNGYIWKYDFEKKFNQWAKENRFREFSDVAIGKKMKERGFEVIRKIASWLNDGKGGQLRAYSGIRWKE